jgi:caffeoyl-CoA O-methyltransferase
MKFEDVDTYLQRLTPKRDRTQAAMETYARKNGFPIIGPLVGRFLYQMALVSRARNILELGSGYGYSAYWFARATGRKGRITMTDADESNCLRAFQYFKQGRLQARLDYLVGDALDLAGQLDGPFDIILNDIDKEAYPKVINLAAKLLRPGGLLISDNVIWSGKVFNSSSKDASTRAVRAFTKKLYADRRFFTTLLPLRDGIAVAVRV